MLLGLSGNFPHNFDVDDVDEEVEDDELEVGEINVLELCRVTALTSMRILILEVDLEILDQLVS